ncbi:O-antigen ligase family protein [Lacinutrix salivirga]
MSLKLNINTIFDKSIYFLVFCGLLLPWFSIGSLGSSFEVRFFHIAIVLLIVKFTLNPKIKIIPTSTYFTFFIFLSFTIFFISIFWSVNKSYGITLFVKNFIYFVFFILISDFFLRDIDNFKRRIIKYAKLSIYIFVFYNVLVTIALGEDIFFKTIFGVFSENANKINYRYFFRLVNFRILDFDFLVWGDDGFHVPSFRNIFGVSIIIVYSILDTIKNPSRWEKSLKVFLIVLIFISQSRSTMIIFLIIFSIKYLVNKKSKKLFLVLLFSPLVLLVALLFFDFGVFQRFTEFSEDARVYMFINTFNEIFSNPILGKGFGALIETNGKINHVHNFVIAAWYSSGILGLLFSLIVVLELGLKFYNKIKFKSKNFKYYFIYGFPLLVIIRMMVGGNNGLPSFHDWFALSIFYTSLYIFNTNNSSTLKSKDNNE